MNLAEQRYDKKKFNLAVFGLSIAIVASIANATFPIFNSSEMDMVTAQMGVGDILIALYIVTLICVSTAEILAAIFTIIFNTIKGGYPLAEYGRIWKVKVSRTILISAILGGPIGTACNMIATKLCGVTYTAIIVGLTPVISVVLARIFLKEKLKARAILGVCIVVVGCIVAALAPPEGVENFYLGIAIACLCPLAFAGENIISTHAVDVCDPRIACPFYRMLGAAAIELTISLVVAICTGHLDIFTGAFATLFSMPKALLFMVMTSIFMSIQYNMTYTAYTYCGAVRAGSLLFAYSAFTVPVGVILAGFGVAEYNITGLAIIATAITVLGIILVIGNPKEIFTLRDTK